MSQGPPEDDDEGSLDELDGLLELGSLLLLDEELDGLLDEELLELLDDEGGRELDELGLLLDDELDDEELLGGCEELLELLDEELEELLEELLGIELLDEELLDEELLELDRLELLLLLDEDDEELLESLVQQHGMPAMPTSTRKPSMVSRSSMVIATRLLRRKSQACRRCQRPTTDHQRPRSRLVLSLGRSCHQGPTWARNKHR